MELPANHPDLFSLLPVPQQGGGGSACAAAGTAATAATARSAAAAPATAAPAASPAAVAARSLARTGARVSARLALPLFAATPASPSPAPVPQPAPAHPQAPPEALHPALWRAHQVARPAHPVWASGFAALDQQLPGGGWPAGTLTELLLPHPGVGELRLLAPVLLGLQAQQRSVMWFDPPAQPCPWALGALGLDMRQQLVVQSRPLAAAPPRPARARPAVRERAPAADILWALEQALKSGQVGAVLAWLPQRLPADALRRLQLAAQLHEGPVFLLRAAEERSRASAAPLRLLLSAWGPDLLRVAIVKRRGAPLAEPLLLELPPVLSAPALARALRGPARGAVWAVAEGAAGLAAAGAETAAPQAAAAEAGPAATRSGLHTTQRPP